MDAKSEVMTESASRLARLHRLEQAWSTTLTASLGRIVELAVQPTYKDELSEATARIEALLVEQQGMSTTSEELRSQIEAVKQKSVADLDEAQTRAENLATEANERMLAIKKLEEEKSTLSKGNQALQQSKELLMQDVWALQSENGVLTNRVAWLKRNGVRMVELMCQMKDDVEKFTSTRRV
jgi:chromosome segregation ATPase